MSKADKQINRLLSFPKDFTYTELKTVLSSFGYSARVYFSKEDHKIKLHKPHPGNILKRYQLDLIVDELKKKRLISNS
ncbi:MAG: type II toxin-antitoxin system HicA family toxin [Prevotellaceae bacterium]|jgi:hypothetical protein|nr:type II toxin-antitoxin system HicA family toxin [Prevotellaceae bacterium]